MIIGGKMKIKRESIAFPSKEKGQTIRGELIVPTEQPKAVVQFAHGMCDYGKRYMELFSFLAEHGFAVAYSDHLGHGMTAAHERDLGFIAKHDGYQKMIDDFYGCYSLLKRRFPEQKHFVMGHSMGSFIVRCFLCCYPGLASGAIIMGTGAKNPGAAPGRFLAKMTVKAKGERYRSKMLEHLVFGSYNRRIQNPVSDWAWLCRDDNVVIEMSKDEKRNKTFTASGFVDLITLNILANDSRTMKTIDPKMPVLFLSGEEDPLGPYGKGVKNVAKIYQNAGLCDVNVKLYPGARHELCQELNRKEVFCDLLQWLETYC